MPLWTYDNKPNSQLEIDTLAVFVDQTKKLEDFSLEYAQKIKSTWRFSAHRYTTNNGRPGKLSPETLDPV